MNFNNIIGNNDIKDFLTKSVKNETILHSYMFIGQPGIGKKLFAERFAEMVLHSNIENNPDYLFIEPDGKNIKIDQIREMQNKVAEKPVNLRKKIYIINDSDLMTKEAQNCLLKTLEEPPEYIVIILIVSNENKILTTIKSRCMKLYFEKIDDDEIKKFLIQDCGINDVSNNILKLCDGSIGKCLNINENLDDYRQIDDIFLKINDSFTSFINSSELLYKNKENINDYLEYINVILYSMAKEKGNSLKYFNGIKIVENAKKRLMANSNYDMCIDYLLFNLWEEVNEKNCRS